MPLARKQIRNNAHAFVKEWKGESREHAEAKSFWEAFFQVFGVNRRRIASFEEPVKKVDSGTGFIDLLWKGKLLIEHKSKGKDLDKAYSQALNYFTGLKDKELPRYVMVSDFDRFRLYDLDSDACFEFTLDELPDNIHLFDFIAGYEDITDRHEEYELNIQAAEKLGDLHDALLESGYNGHHLEVFLVRILFCIFAEDTGIFNRHQFINYLINFTCDDGTDIEMHLAKLFQILDKSDSDRNLNLSEELNAFPYVNGHLFSERIDMPSFTAGMREMLIECAYFDWGSISPAIFGSLFQSVMDKKSRRNLGAHYTSEKNILRLVRPLFLDELYERFTKIQIMKQPNKKQKALLDFQYELSTLSFLDPACGCGNFLVITYREMRRLELAVLKEQQKDNLNQHIGFEIDPLISLNNFYGIEIEEWPTRIAEVAMWLTEHQTNREFAKQFGREPDLLPLKKAAHIVNGNALEINWDDIICASNLSFILGNPPFIGKKEQSKDQKNEVLRIFGKIKGAGILDYVTCWYKKSVEYMKNNTDIKASFVSTNSITQGEQVGVLWSALYPLGVKINFAHRTFEWTSEARGRAAVHVVIIGFTLKESEKKILFNYKTVRSEPNATNVSKLNPYLIEGKEVVAVSRTKPISQCAPKMNYGSMPIDNGWLILNEDEKNEFILDEPSIEKFIKIYIGGDEFLNNGRRYCLWLVDSDPSEWRKSKKILSRVESNREYRASRDREQTKKLSKTPAIFGEIRQPSSNYLLIPKVSSENREYMPIGFCEPSIIVSGSALVIPDATIYHFGVLQSRMHMSWMKVVCGRMKSDYQYSKKLVYNNFIWPEPENKNIETVEEKAKIVLEVRNKYSTSTLADLYDPLSMPSDLINAHNNLDKAVDSCYRSELFKSDGDRLDLLFNKYNRLVH